MPKLNIKVENQNIEDCKIEFENEDLAKIVKSLTIKMNNKNIFAIADLILHDLELTELDTQLRIKIGDKQYYLIDPDDIKNVPDSLSQRIIKDFLRIYEYENLPY